jgi:hypothetical protein
MKRKRITRDATPLKARPEAAARAKGSKTHDYRSWLGLALKAPLNPKPRFRNEDELWK